jgi:UDP-N-acetylmuramoylalanine--D-glutamate ligase
MIPLRTIPDRPVAVFGLGKSGLATAAALLRSGATVWAWDDGESARAHAAAMGARLVELQGCDWSRPGTLVLSPGIPHTHPAPHPVVAAAKSHGLEIIGDVELFARALGAGALPQAACIGVTGTNGKSTTTSLIGHVLQAAGRPAVAGGNLGTPVLAFDPLPADGVYVLELSSYQLELTRSLACRAAVLLNVTPDHLGRHGGIEGYVAAKVRIFANQGRGDTAIVGIDDAHCRAVREALIAAGKERVVAISTEIRVPGGIHAVHGNLVDDTGGANRLVLDLAEAPALPGAHNWQNAAAAYAACRAVGLAPDVIAQGLRSYPGLAHRQELVATLNGVRYINDSKATNADATAKALACYEPIYWILGGRPKETGLDGLEGFYPRIAHGFLIGEAEEAFAGVLSGNVPATRCGTLGAAVAAAHEMAQRERRPGAVVLLSPACASFDQFANFEERGDAFRRLVLALAPGSVAGKVRRAAS